MAQSNDEGSVPLTSATTVGEDGVSGVAHVENEHLRVPALGNEHMRSAALRNISARTAASNLRWKRRTDKILQRQLSRARKEVELQKRRNAALERELAQRCSVELDPVL